MHSAPPLGPAVPDSMPPTSPKLPADTAMTVYFDGSCPLCRREIGVYRGLHALQPVCFADVSNPALVPPPGKSPSALKARFHVRHADGRLDSGARAFLALWAALPGWRWLARVGSVPGVPHVMEWAYRAFLRVRPAVQRTALRLERWADRTASTRLPQPLLRELRTDHAGETGAVMIYRGVLAVSKDPVLRAFAQHHLETERRHLALIEAVLPTPWRSRLLPLWRLSGWLTGALPACFGPRSVYATIQAVETFVDRHYAQQLTLIDELLLPPKGPASDTRAGALAETDLRALRAMLLDCRQDEVAHRDDAAARWDGRAGLLMRGWRWLVSHGSEMAVRVCRRF